MIRSSDAPASTHPRQRRGRAGGRLTLLAALLLLGGCAVPPPRATCTATPAASCGAQTALPPRAASAPSAAAARPASPAAAASRAAPASAPAQAGAAQPDDTLSMPGIERMLQRVAAMSAAASRSRQQYLQAMGRMRSAGERLELGYLLLTRPAPAGRPPASAGNGSSTSTPAAAQAAAAGPGSGAASAASAPSAEEAMQARDLLKGLQDLTADPASRQFIELLQRLGQQSVEWARTRTELGKVQRKAADLEDKIGQIKNLEVQLQGRTQERAAKPPARRPAGAER